MIKMLMRNLKKNCIIEINPDKLTGNTLQDTAGGGNIGVLIGDYNVIKIDTGIPISRETSDNLPDLEKDTENGAF